MFEFRKQSVFIALQFLTERFVGCSPEAQELGFTVIIDTRGSSYNAIKPVLKTLEDGKISILKVHHVYLTKPDTFWQKQRTSLAKGKFKYEVSTQVRLSFESEHDI